MFLRAWFVLRILLFLYIDQAWSFPGASERDVTSTAHPVAPPVVNRGAARQMYGSGSLRQAGSIPISYATNSPKHHSSVTSDPGVSHPPDIVPHPMYPIPPETPQYETPYFRSHGLSRSGGGTVGGVYSSGPIGPRPGGRRPDSYEGIGDYPGFDRGDYDTGPRRVDVPRPRGGFRGDPASASRSVLDPEMGLLAPDTPGGEGGEEEEGHPCGGSCKPDEFECDKSCMCIKADLRCDGESDCDDGEDEYGCGGDIEGEDLHSLGGYLGLRGKCDEADDKVRCPLSGRCIRKDWLCDGDDDCGDFSDETHCGTRYNCTADQFECANGLCIQQSWVCDNDNDCKDYSDEINCNKAECSSDQFHCGDDSCISLAWQCDGQADCIDGSDEHGCEKPLLECGEGEFKCGGPSPHKCIKSRFRCDGDNDCGDWSDEEDCPRPTAAGGSTCVSGEFKCNDNMCVPERWRCDKQQDCKGGEDELGCDVQDTRTCSPEEFSCQDGRCILRTWVCDGVADCAQGEDERKCVVTCEEGQFTCQAVSNSTSAINTASRLCVARKHVCDGQKDCPRGDDEMSCPRRKTCDAKSPCEQLCIITSDGKDECSCHPGYKLGTDGHSCLDIDECLYQADPVCSQTCNNTIGSFVCGCMTGYILRPDLRTCKAMGAPPTLLFANRQDIRQVSLSSNKYTAVLKGLHNAIALDYHYKKNLVVWSDVASDVIRSAFMNGSGTIDIIKWGLESPGGVAVDWIHDLIFWTDSGTRRVEVATLDGSQRAVIVASDLDKPRAIAVHPGEAMIFWTDWGPSPKIERADMDGSSRKSIITESVFWPNGLTLDYTTSKIYWADAKHHVIECSYFDGSERKKVMSKGLPHPFAITMFEDAIYWTDWHTKSISTANKATGAGLRTVHAGLHFPMDIHSYHPQRQPEYNSRCPGNLGGCSHMCLPNTKGRSCMCPIGKSLLKDGKTCSDTTDNLLLFARKKDIRIRQLRQTPSALDVDMVVPVDGIKSAVALAWDSRTDSVFWTDVDKDSISSAHLNGSNQKVIVHANLISPAGLALDWLTNKIYWTDAGTNRIEVADIEGGERALLVWDDLDKPRDIVVDPLNGYMYWSDWGADHKIERAAMDGSQRKVLVSGNLTWPNGLAIDHDLGRLYWADGGTKSIEFSKMDGSGRNVLIGTNLPHPFGLDVFKNDIIWTDWETYSIESAHKSTGKGRRTIDTGISGLMDVRVFHRERKYPSTPCTRNNGGCTHLCLLKPKNEHSCACPIGIKKLINGKGCAEGPSSFLIFAHRVDIRRISLDVPYVVDVVLPLPVLKRAVAVDVDKKTGDIYWTDAVEDVIHKSTKHFETIETVIKDGLDNPDGLAIDSAGRKIYWTDATRHSIEVSELDGTNRRVLVSSGLDSPRAIVLHYDLGLMFWSDWGGNATIEVADMDGSNRRVLISQGLGWPNGLAIDHIEHRLYWTDGQKKVIESCNFEGKDRKTVLEGVAHPYGIVIVDDQIYWTDWKTKSVHKVNKRGGANSTVLRDKLEGLMSIGAVKDGEHVPENACGFNNGGCSHLCLRTSAGYSCACPTGLNMVNGSTSICRDLPERYLLFSTRSSLARISLDTAEAFDYTLPIPDVKNAIALDFHFKKQLVYYSDVLQDVIKSVDVKNLSDSRTIIQFRIDTPNGLGVDWIADNIYWTDHELKVLEVARFDGTSRKQLISEMLDEPRSLALFPMKGFMFWSDWGKTPKIERASLDGTNRKIILSGNMGFPHGLVIDYGEKRLYWADALKDRIESSDLNGNNRTTIIPEAKHPFGVTLLGPHIYWTNWFKKSVMRADKHSGQGVTTFRADLPGAMEIHAVAPETQTGWNPCAENNGGCSHLCLFRSWKEGYFCACPDEDDGKPCSLEPTARVSSKRGPGFPDYIDDPEDTGTGAGAGGSGSKSAAGSKDSHGAGGGSHAAGRLTGLSATAVLVATAVLGTLLLAVVAIILVMMYNKRKVSNKYKYGSGRNILTFSNPNYSMGATAGAGAGGSKSTSSATDKKPALWKRMKYDKAQDRVYEDKATLNSPEVASLIPGRSPSPMPSPSCDPLNRSMASTACGSADEICHMQTIPL